MKKPDAVILAECVAALAHNIPRGTSHCVLVLDEANRFLDTKATPETLKLFDALVKQTKKLLMSAVLLSSDEGMPFRLREIGIQTTHLKRTLVVGEIAPAQMLSTLESLGVGEHLRHLLVQIYGGHLWHIISAVSTMSICGDIKLEVEQESISSIRSALGQWKKMGGDTAELVAVLKKVARCGFCELDSADERAHLLTTCNVCTYLVDGAQEFFLDPAVCQGRCGVAASTQLVRVLIASVLQEYDGNPDSE